MATHARTVDRIDGETFLIIGRDGPGAAAIRESQLDAHLEYVEKNCDRYLAAGPMREPGEPVLNGSFFLVVAENQDEARRIVEGDPYVSSGLYENVEVKAVTVAAGRLLGGVIWESADAVRDFAAKARQS